MPRLEHAGWQLKRYSITCEECGGDRACVASFQAGVEQVLGMLPEPAPDAGRPGVGFLILHAGRGADYAVLCWWDRENELPMRISVRTHGQDGWRLARGNESVCVWDLEILWAEREAYVRHVLRAEPDIGAYLDDVKR